MKAVACLVMICLLFSFPLLRRRKIIPFNYVSIGNKITTTLLHVNSHVRQIIILNDVFV